MPLSRLTTLLSFLLWAPFLLLACAQNGPEPFDLLIRGGDVVDGTGSPARRADVGIRGDTIDAIGDLSGHPAVQVVEADGLVVAPGFIDMHSHSDFTLLVDGKGLSKVTQGVTTELLGESGSAAPLVGEARAPVEKGLGEMGITLDWATLGEYFARLEREGMSVNIVSMVGSGRIREAVVGFDNRPPTAEEMKRMKELVEEAMTDGAAGLSSGLIYPPNGYATTEELIALATVAARYGGFYLSHIRGEDERLLQALQEAIEIGREANLPVEVLHFKRSSMRLGQEPDPSIQDAAALIEKAQQEGVAVHANLYPYSASQTTLNVRLPAWAQEGGNQKLVERLRNPETRQRIRKELAALLSKGIAGATPDTILFGSTPYEAHKNLQGKRIAEIAELMEVDAAEAYLELIDKAEGQTRAIYFGMREEDVRFALALPWTSIGSDGTAIAPVGILARSHPHPRWYGTFPRVLGYYVREEKVLTLPEAIRKMTSLPATRLGLADRGTLAPGFKADVVVFDRETIRDRSTFTEPHQLSEGVEFLTVNGELVLEDGEHTGAKPGRVLRHKKGEASTD